MNRESDESNSTKARERRALAMRRLRKIDVLLDYRGATGALAA